jgi:Thioredoxin
VSRLLVVAFVTAAFVLVGCDTARVRADESFVLAQARAAVAFAEAELEQEQPAAPRQTCDDCNGTGTVPSGDGLARVPCECGDACRCEPARLSTTSARETVIPRRKRLLYFTASWCAACRGNDATLRVLKSRGWQIGPGEENHIQIVDLDARPDLQARYAVRGVPTWVLIEDGRERRRCCGVLDPFAVGRLFGN